MNLRTGSRFGSLTLVAILHLLLVLLLISAFAVTVVKKAADPSTPLIEIVTAIEPVQEEASPSTAAEPDAGGGSPPSTAALPAPAAMGAPLPDMTVSTVAPPAPAMPGPIVNDRPGSGASSGTGSGLGPGAGSGIGPGNVAGSGLAVRARRIKGFISSEDYPAAPLRSKVQGTTGVELTISAAGRVTACSVVKSSGNGELDSTVCQLAQQRFIFQPARDRSGAVATDKKREYFTWVLPR